MLDDTIKKCLHFSRNQDGDYASAVAKCPKVCISAHGIQIPSLIDSSSEVTLLWQSYFDQHILPKIKPATGEEADAHCLFKLTVAKDGQMAIKMYTELDLTFLGLKVL